MWSSYVKPIVWSSFVPCSTYLSTSKVVNSVSTSYLTSLITSYSWTTGTSYTTISTTVTATDYTTQTRTKDETSWVTATSLTTKPILVTQQYSTTKTLLETKPTFTTEYFEVTETLLETLPISTYETIRTTLTGRETQTDVETIYTTASVTQIYVTSRTAVTSLTSRTTYTTLVSSEVLMSSTVLPEPPPPPSPPPPPPQDSTTSPSVIPSPEPPPPPSPTVSATSSIIILSPEPLPPPSPIITSPPPPPPPNPCESPPVNEFFSVSWFGWRPDPDVEPLVTLYPTVYGDFNVTLTSTFCNTDAFEKYYQTNFFDCARGCGPSQTLNAECSIVLGPVFTGTTCGGQGYKITQFGSSGNVVDLDTSIVGRGLTVDGTCIPTTTTVLETPLIYTGDVRNRGSVETAIARRQAAAGDQVVLGDNPSGLENPFDQPTDAVFNYNDQGPQTELRGANVLTKPEATVDGPPPASQGTALLVTEPTEAPSASPTQPAPAQTPKDTPTAVPEDNPTAAPDSATTGSAPSPPISPTPESTAPAGGQSGSMTMFPSGDAFLSALTCVPLSLVNTSAIDAAVSTTAGSSVPQQTTNAVSHLATHFLLSGWLCACIGLYALF